VGIYILFVLFYYSSHNDKFFMAKLVTTTIYIGKTLITQFTEFSLVQSIFAHHNFKIVCPSDFFESLEPFAKTKSLIGERCEITISNFDGTGEPLQFLGVVTELATNKFNGYIGDTIIYGYSPTIVMDNVPHCKTWEKKALKNIVTDIANVFSSNQLRFQIKPRSHETLAYTVQYKESAWQFINRLAATYGEWLFYNGKQVVFGAFEPQSTELIFGSNLTHFSMAMQLRPSSFTQTAYDYLNSKVYVSKPDGIPGRAGLNELGEYVFNKSKDFFSTVPKSYSHQYVTNKNQLDEMVKTKAAAQSSNHIRFVGNSTKFGVQLGNDVTINGNYGTYKIIEVKHVCDGMGNYYNDFTAIPASIMVPPVTDYVDPHCETQTAIVTENHDKQGMGRVRVRFHWMNGDEQTPWIRIVNPHAGNGKGMYFIPEKGEHVLIGFENANPSKPFVLGSMYHAGENASGLNNTASNNIKAIQTKSNNRIVMDDDAASVFTSDGAGGADTLMDGKGNYITNVQKDETTNVGTNSTTNVGAQQVINVGGDKNGASPQAMFKMDNAGNIVFEGKNSLSITIGGSTLTMDKEGNITLNGKNVKIVGSETTEVGKAGGNPGMVVDGNVTVKGADVLIN
jgi:type VI secretion system secreted protein VgrG